MKHLPVRTLDDLASLDDVEILEGYRDGFAGEPEPGDNRSRSYWHGWRNGSVDGGHIEKDNYMAALAADMHEVLSGARGRSPNTAALLQRLSRK